MTFTIFPLTDAMILTVITVLKMLSKLFQQQNQPTSTPTTTEKTAPTPTEIPTPTPTPT